MDKGIVKELGFFQRFVHRITGRRKTIMLAGYAHSGKTTILTVLHLKRDVTDEDVERNTVGLKRYYLEYKTNKDKSIYIKSVDTAGTPMTVNDSIFDEELKRHDYIIYFLNVYEFVKVYDAAAKEWSLTWLQKINRFARDNGKLMLLVLSHADKYLEEVENKEYSKANKAIIRELFFSDSGLLSRLDYSCNYMIENVQKFNDVKEIINYFV